MAVQQQQSAFCDQLLRYVGDTSLPHVHVAYQHYIVLDGTTSHGLQLLRPPGLQELMNACHPVMFLAEFLHLPQHALDADKVLRAEVGSYDGH